MQNQAKQNSIRKNKFLTTQKPENCRIVQSLCQEMDHFWPRKRYQTKRMPTCQDAAEGASRNAFPPISPLGALADRRREDAAPAGLRRFSGTVRRPLVRKLDRFRSVLDAGSPHRLRSRRCAAERRRQHLLLVEQVHGPTVRQAQTRGHDDLVSVVAGHVVHRQLAAPLRAADAVDENVVIVIGQRAGEVH